MLCLPTLKWFNAHWNLYLVCIDSMSIESIVCGTGGRDKRERDR